VRDPKANYGEGEGDLSVQRCLVVIARILIETEVRKYHGGMYEYPESRSDELFLVPVFASSYVVIDILLVFQEKEL